MVTALENDDQQANLAGHMLQARDATSFVQQLRAATPALQQFTRNVRGASQAQSNWTSFAAVKGAWAATSYVGRNIGSASGSSFLERRLDWALFGAGTGGTSAIGKGLVASARAGELSYSSDSGLSIGTTGTQAISFYAAKWLADKTGLDPFGTGVQAISKGAEETAALTSKIARYGGTVTPEFRNFYMQLKTAENDRAIQEEQKVQRLAYGMLGTREQQSSQPNITNETLKEIGGYLAEIKNAMMNWITGHSAGGG